MLTLDGDHIAKFKGLPVNQTITFQLDDRNFSIIDTEFLNEILEKAGVLVHPANTFRG